MYVRAYRAVKMGMSNHQAARYLGVTQSTFDRWIKERPAFAEAVREGRMKEGSLGSFRAMYQMRLSPECRKYWEELTQADGKKRRSAQKRLADLGGKLRQHVYLFALAECDLAASKARAVADVDPAEVAVWCADPAFARLLAEINECKKDFFEGSFIDLVASGDPAAIIHAAKTVNRDRGYGEKIQVEHGTARQLGRPDLGNLSADELRQLHGLIEKAKGRPKLLTHNKGTTIADVDDGEEDDEE